MCFYSKGPQMTSKDINLRRYSIWTWIRPWTGDPFLTRVRGLRSKGVTAVLTAEASLLMRP